MPPQYTAMEGPKLHNQKYPSDNDTPKPMLDVSHYILLWLVFVKNTSKDIMWFFSHHLYCTI